MPGVYDPNIESTDEEVAIAGRWELLRRNSAFQEVAARWAKSEEFRRSHAMTSEYHNLQNHTPRCALDWMLTAEERVALAKFQIEQLKWIRDPRFNFGPILCSENFPAANVTRENLREYQNVKSLPGAPPPLQMSHSWDIAPDLFKKEFTVAYDATSRLTQLNERLEEISQTLRLAGRKLVHGDKLNEMSVIGSVLFDLGTELHDLGELARVYKIPKRVFSEKQLKERLQEIRKDFDDSKLLVPTALYDTHKSYQGTAEDWEWFLEAERLGLDIRKPADLWKLSQRYCEVLRERVLRGEAPPRAKPHGYTGTAFPSKIIKNRRNTVKRHVQSIEKWIDGVYLPRQPDPDIPAI